MWIYELDPGSSRSVCQFCWPGITKSGAPRNFPETWHTLESSLRPCLFQHLERFWIVEASCWRAVGNFVAFKFTSVGCSGMGLWNTSLVFNIWRRACMYACMYACRLLCMHACMHDACMCVCMYACMHTCMPVCMCACMHACMHACLHVWRCAGVHACMYVFNSMQVNWIQFNSI